MSTRSGRITALRERTVGAIVAANNARIRATDPCTDNPRRLADTPWFAGLSSRYPTIRREWDAFAASGGALPRIEEVLTEDQGNDGAWHAGLLVVRGRAVPAMGERFPATIAAVRTIPGLLAALWSVLEPGAELPAHAGPNAGVLRFHLGIVSNDLAALSIADTVVPYEEGQGVLFDDTAIHAAWNRGTNPRVTLMCELRRPLPPPRSWLNNGVQCLIYLDSRYRHAPNRATAWDQAMNGGV